MRRGFFGRVLLAVGAGCITVLASGAAAAADATQPAAAAPSQTQPAANAPAATQAAPAHTSSNSSSMAAPAKSTGGEGVTAQAQPGSVPGADQHWGMLKQYCSKCHNAEDWAGGVAFDTMTPEEIPDQAEIWEHAVRKLRGRLMPPPGNPQPDSATVKGFVGWL